MARKRATDNTEPLEMAPPRFSRFGLSVLSVLSVAKLFFPEPRPCCPRPVSAAAAGPPLLGSNRDHRIDA
jgi:hypothetical protein